MGSGCMRAAPGQQLATARQSTGLLRLQCEAYSSHCSWRAQQTHVACVGVGRTLPHPFSVPRLFSHRSAQIIDMSTSKTGKHGHAKVHLIATDIFTQRKYEDISPSTHNMDVPNVSRNEYQLVNIDDGFLNLMSGDGSSKDDVKVPEGELGEQIESGFEDGKDLMVTIVSAMGEEQAISFKEAGPGK